VNRSTGSPFTVYPSRPLPPSQSAFRRLGQLGPGGSIPGKHRGSNVHVQLDQLAPGSPGWLFAENPVEILSQHRCPRGVGSPEEHAECIPSNAANDITGAYV
jgi:hypothetical protein